MKSYVDPTASAFDKYWMYITERQAIWHRRFRDKLPAPWTEDATLQRYSFTNVYRQLDRGTVYYIQTVLESWARSGTNVGYLVFLTAAYRLFNRIDTWENCFRPNIDALLDGKPSAFVDTEAALRTMAAKSSVFTGAFWVCGYGSAPGHDKIAKMINFLKIIHENAKSGYLKANVWNQSTPKAYHRTLQELPGIGPFLAYEIYSDLIYAGIDVFPFEEDAWANAGPGAMKGINMIWPNRRDYEAAMVELRDNQYECFERLGLPFDHYALSNGVNPMPLTMRNIEHNLCEFSKYMRGSARMKFVDHGNALYESVIDTLDEEDPF